MNKIGDLTNLLREVRQEFQKAYNDADAAKKAETATLNSDFIRNTPSYKQRQEEIDENFDIAVARAQRRAAERGNIEIESLRDFELSRISRIDTDTLTKINAISDLALTREEMQVLSNRFGTGYWNQRALSNVASKNGIDPQSIGLEPPIDAKMTVLNEMESQLDRMITGYDTDVNNHKSRDARLLFLSDPVLQNAENLYTTGSVELSKADTVGRTYGTIKALPGEMQKALMISNSLRNLRGDERNMLMYQLAGDTTISDQVYAVAGCLEEINTWKSGLSMRYGEAVKMRENLRTSVDVNAIKTTLSSYEDKLKDAGQTNPFLDDTLATLAKNNSAVAEALGVADTTMDTTDAEATDTTNTEE